MHSAINIWELLAGVAVFLLGMKFLEDSLQQLTGRTFKLFLKKQTATKPKAILSGLLVTGIFQSSSVVNMMLLAFVGANVIPMQHALAVILGSNLGSTVTSWIILSIGFNTSIEQITFPLIGLGGILISLSNKDTKWYKWSKFFMGMGFLLLGLAYIKSGTEAFIAMIDLTSFSHYPAIVFLLVGFLMTTLIQSSSATVIIVLSALHINALNFYDASAIVLGSEIGTTIKFLLASVKGTPAKKRVAVGNFMYNIIIASLVLIFLHPINNFIKDIAGINDNLFALVFFQTLVNIIGIIIFYPFLNQYGKFLEKLFKTNDDETAFIHKVSVNDTGLAMVALENELKHFIINIIGFTRAAFEIPRSKINEDVLSQNNHHGNVKDYYEYLKHLHGDIYTYANQLQVLTDNDKEIALRINQLMATNRNTMYTAKTIKDTLQDISSLRNSSNDVKYRFYLNAAGTAAEFCKKVTDVLQDNKSSGIFETLNQLYTSVSGGYTDRLKQLYKEKLYLQLSEVEISTLINFNMEIHTAFKSCVFAVKDFLLDEKEAAWFDELPRFSR